MPMKTVASLIVIVALGTMGYFQIIERLNIADTRLQLMEKMLKKLMYWVRFLMVNVLDLFMQTQLLMVVKVLVLRRYH